MSSRWIGTGWAPYFFWVHSSNFPNFRDISDPFSLYLMFHIWDPVQGLDRWSM